MVCRLGLSRLFASRRSRREFWRQPALNLRASAQGARAHPALSCVLLGGCARPVLARKLQYALHVRGRVPPSAGVDFSTLSNPRPLARSEFERKFCEGRAQDHVGHRDGLHVLNLSRFNSGALAPSNGSLLRSYFRREVGASERSCILGHARVGLPLARHVRSNRKGPVP